MYLMEVYKIFLITLVLCSFRTVICSHFRGGIITWKPFGNQVKISYRLAFRRSFSSNFYCDAATISSLLPGEEALQCLYGCSGNIVPSMSYYCTDFSADEDWSSGEHTVVYKFPVSTSNIYHFGYISSAWIPLAEGGSGWSMRTAANLTVRMDTGQINSSPISAMKPITRMKHGCQYSIHIPVQDDDGDKVKCRWSTKTRYDECGGVCQTLSDSVLDEISCILHYNATKSIGWYAVAVQLEDFAVSNDMIPLSSVPLQFLIQVFTSNGFCKDRPVLIKTNFIDGTNIPISLYSTLCEIMIAKSATNTSVIIEIETVSPIGMLKSNLKVFGDTGREWFVIVKWIPTEDQIGSHIFCYTAIDSNGQSSDQTCVTLVVIGSITTTKNEKATTTATPLIKEQTTVFCEPTPISTVPTTVTPTPPVLTTDWIIVIVVCGTIMLIFLCSCIYMLLRVSRRNRRNQNDDPIYYTPSLNTVTNNNEIHSYSTTSMNETDIIPDAELKSWKSCDNQ
ncbi:uncharacterized protein LOC134683591 [Mytilus trossulus]|uniref:uncharacterized protein LOC134683591 n=1 Tax=Mytilus trossulus TaxID=6551 RepID=UPI003005FA49